MGFFKLNKSPSSTLLSRFVFIIIAVWLIIINLQLNAVFATNYGRHHIHHHRLPHNCHHGRSMSSWHSIPPTSSWSDISTDSNRFTSLQHQEYSPINMDYTMETNLDQENEQSFIREEDLIKSSLNNEEKNIFIPYSFPTASWNDHQPNIYHIKKIKKRRKKKKPTKKVYYPELENPITNNDGQINRIVFIEEPENEHVKFNDAIEPIVEKQIIKTIIGQENINNLNSNFNSIQSQFQPQSQETPLIRPKITVSDEYTSKPIVTIKDLHEKLNQTLLYRIPDTDNKLGYDIQSNITNGILMIPSNLNKKIQPQQLMKTANYGNNNYFVKSNNFSFENSWNYVTSTESSNNIDYKLNDNNKNNNNKTNEQLVPSDSTNRQWLSSTIPSVVYFTSQRTIPQLQFNSVVTKPTISTTTHRNKIKNNDILEYSPRRNSAQTDKRGIGNVNVADVSMQKIASIIFAICISLMLFSCVIVMILYKDTVSEQFRSFVTRSESDSNNNNSNNNNNNPAPETNSHASSSNSTSSSNSSNFPITILPQPIDPPSSRMRNTNIVGLEQIMVNQDDSLESKKYRHYFSRMHRWSPKRPPLPTDLVDPVQQS